MKRSIAAKSVAGLISMLMVFATAPFSLTETFSTAPLGAIMTPGQVTVGSTPAPSGTTLFGGDKVVALQDPALISFTNGSRVEMTKAAATFTRDGDTLVVDAREGLLRFNFIAGEPVRIRAGKYQLSAVGRTAHKGELGLNRNGKIVATVSEGILAGLNTVSGHRFEVLPNMPLVMLDEEGKATINKGSKTLTDPSKSWQPDELKGKCVVAGGEALPITGNTSNTISLKGSWKSISGTMDYKITDCTVDALTAAGATASAASAAASAGAGAGAAAVGAAVGTGTAAAASTTAAVVVGIAAAAAGVGVGVYEGTKSPSSR